MIKSINLWNMFYVIAMVINPFFLLFTGLQVMFKTLKKLKNDIGIEFIVNPSLNKPKARSASLDVIEGKYK